MTREEILNELKINGAKLQGTTRPSQNRQLDFWSIKGVDVLIKTDVFWVSGTTEPGSIVKHEYNRILTIHELVIIE